MSTHHLTTTVVLESIGNVEVSTINLAKTSPFWRGIETCLFWANESQVVATYSTWQEAESGHATWTNPETLARFLTSAVN